MTKDLIKTLRRLQKTFTDVLDDTDLNDLEPYVNGVLRGLEIAIQEISERDPEQNCTDKCAEDAQDCTDTSSSLSDEESEKTSGEPAEESSASLPEDCTGPFNFPYRGLNTPEEVLEYLKRKQILHG